MANADRAKSIECLPVWPKPGLRKLGFPHVAAFAGVVDAGSFTLAARRMRLSKATLSKRVAQLEELLGACLLSRTTRSLRVTEQGARLYAHCRRILDEWAAAEAELLESSGPPRGCLRLCVPSHIGSQGFVPVLQGFMELHPKVDVDLILGDQLAPHPNADSDVQLLVGPLSSASRSSVLLARCVRVICAAPSYLDRFGAPESLADLTRHNCLCFQDRPDGATWFLEGPEGLAAVKVRGRFRANNEAALKNAVLSGLGLALMPEPIVEIDLATGRLLALLPDYRDRSHGLFMECSAQGALNPAVRAFSTYLKAHYRAPDKLLKPAGLVPEVVQHAC